MKVKMIQILSLKRAIKRLFDYSRYNIGGDLYEIPPRLHLLPPLFFDILPWLLLAAILVLFFD